MVPIRIAIKNFMCYRDDVPVLELDNLHVACLCGDNGHGKSALLDAITWALWGQTRARTQEELVHQGQKDMAVEIDFLARGQKYHVSRSHSRSARSKQGTTLLELQIYSGNGLQPITGNSIRDTEARIREILHMDYDTFINTAFLRQGDADRFTTSSPSKRKETLAEVLDLSYYQELEQRAKYFSNNLQDDILVLERDIARDQKEIDLRPELEARLSSITASLSEIEPEVKSQKANLDKIRRTVDQLNAQLSEVETLERQLADSRRNSSHLDKQVNNHQGKIKAYEAALKRQVEIRQQFSRLEESGTELEQLNQALAQQRDLENLKANLDQTLAVQKERLSGQANRLKNGITQDLTPKTNRIPEIEKDIQVIAQKQLNLRNLSEDISRHQEAEREASARSRDLQLANDRLHQEMKETRRKFDMLDQGDNTCPLCNQPLDTAGQIHLRREYEIQGQKSKQNYQENADLLTTIDKRQQELTKTLSGQEIEIKQEQNNAQNRMVNLERDLVEAQTAHAELQTWTADLQRIETLIKTNNYSPNERQQLSQIEVQLAALGYDADQHRKTQEQVKELEIFRGLHRKLQEASDALPIERQDMKAAQQMLERYQHQLHIAQERISILRESLKRRPDLESQLVKIQSRLKDIEAQQQESSIQKHMAERELEKCIALKRKLRHRQNKHYAVVDKKGIYDELTVAFGKNGIQALIIESAIPELEADANRLLGRLTDNRMSLKIQIDQGRRDARTGLPTEELDIKIADEVGTRNYETFSGGEAFRINFALRIALSKLLARRSGAPLPILFIDEGFGSQDITGQERLTEAIQSIQDDFQKIIVITHIDQIKDSFPVRIEVTKTGAGSTFAIV